MNYICQALNWDALGAPYKIAGEVLNTAYNVCASAIGRHGCLPGDQLIDELSVMYNEQRTTSSDGNLSNNAIVNCPHKLFDVLKELKLVLPEITKYETRYTVFGVLYLNIGGNREESEAPYFTQVHTIELEVIEKLREDGDYVYPSSMDGYSCESTVHLFGYDVPIYYSLDYLRYRDELIGKFNSVDALIYYIHAHNLAWCDMYDHRGREITIKHNVLIPTDRQTLEPKRDAMLGWILLGNYRTRAKQYCATDPHSCTVNKSYRLIIVPEDVPTGVRRASDIHGYVYVDDYGVDDPTKGALANFAPYRVLHGHYPNDNWPACSYKYKQHESSTSVYIKNKENTDDIVQHVFVTDDGRVEVRYINDQQCTTPYVDTFVGMFVEDNDADITNDLNVPFKRVRAILRPLS